MSFGAKLQLFREKTTFSASFYVKTVKYSGGFADFCK